MTCTKIQPLLEAFANNDLSALTHWRVRCHLTQCPACTAEMAEIKTLDARVRAWQNVPAPVGLETRIAARLPAAMPAPARPPMRRAAVGLTGFAAALAAAFWLVPGQPGRPTVAFADVERAMQQVQTTSYDSSTKTYDIHNRAHFTATTDWGSTWCRQAPVALAGLDRKTGNRYLCDRRGTLYHNLKKDVYSKSPSSPDVIQAMRDQMQFTPSFAYKGMLLGSSWTQTPWQKQKVVLGGISSLKFTQTTSHNLGQRHCVRHLSIWVDTKALRIIRMEEFGDADWKAEGYQERTIADNFHYNEQLPSGVFDWSPPPGAKVTGHW